MLRWSLSEPPSCPIEGFNRGPRRGNRGNSPEVAMLPKSVPPTGADELPFMKNGNEGAPDPGLPEG